MREKRITRTYIKVTKRNISHIWGRVRRKAIAMKFGTGADVHETVTWAEFDLENKYKQELSYRQQIARQLRTQYAKGIYRHKYYTVTLKSRLRVTHGHWKRNHWIDHTRLSSSRVI